MSPHSNLVTGCPTHLQACTRKNKGGDFQKKGQLKKKEKFNWNGTPIEIVPSYTYLGVTFSSSGLFHVEATEAVNKGLAAQGTTIGNWDYQES
jgi:hypothetical protein